MAPFVQVARDFCKLLQGGSYYADWYEIGPGELSEANDEATVEALRDALAGWFPESQLEREIANVDDALTTHRRAVAERSSQPDPNL